MPSAACTSGPLRPSRILARIVISFVVVITGVAILILVVPAVAGPDGLGLTGSAHASTVADAIDDVTDGVYVAPGSGQDEDALRSVVAEFADDERVVIAVFSGGLPPTPEERAFDLLDAVAADTVLLFTPDDVAAASNIHTAAQVDAAFSDAGAAALDRDAAVASRAFLAALTDTPTPLWVWAAGLVAIIGAVLLVLLLVRRQRQKVEQDRATARARAAFQSRLQTVAARILDLEGPVTLADDPEMTADMAAATGVYRDVQWSFDRVNRAAQIAALDEALAPAEETLERLAAKLG